MNSRIEIILGSMYSGKSTELIRRLSCYDAIKLPTLLINHDFDIRTGNSIKTHSNLLRNAIKTDCLMSLVETPEYIDAEVIGIDEAQFFVDLLDFVKYSELKKTIIISGLDGDYNRKPFWQILECIPLCDSVVKLKAMDMVFNNGTPGIFTKRITKNDNILLIGANEHYISVCRKNYFN